MSTALRAHASTMRHTARKSAKSWWHWCAAAEGKRFLSLLGVALVVRLLLAPYPEIFDDLNAYLQWGLIAQHHLGDFYTAVLQQAVGGNAAPAEYPPLFVYLYTAIVKVYLEVAQLGGTRPQLDLWASGVLATVMKLPAIVSDLGAVVLIYALGRRLQSARWALVAAASYAFSPAVVVDSAVWGQTDGLPVVFVIAALVLAWRRQPLATGVVFALALLLKPQPIIFAPLMSVYLWRWANWRAMVRFLSAAAGACIFVCLPYLVPPVPQLHWYIATFGAITRASPYASFNAFNLWWLLGAQWHNYATPYLGPLTPIAMGWLLFAAAVAVAIAGISRQHSLEALFLSASLVAVASFDVTTLQHERYLYPALALFLVAAFRSALGRIWYVIASTTVILNMAFVVGLDDDRAPVPSLVRSLFAHRMELTTVIAAANIALLLCVVVATIMSRSRGLPEEGVTGLTDSFAAS
jgi:Gpi18-like mannosyltransferase